MRKRHLVASFVLTVAIALATVPAFAQSWKAEFDRICEQTLTATELSVEELRTLVGETEALIARIEKEALAKNKVFLFRLKKCRDFFEFMIELENTERSDVQEAAPESTETDPVQ